MLCVLGVAMAQIRALLLGNLTERMCASVRFASSAQPAGQTRAVEGAMLSGAQQEAKTSARILGQLKQKLEGMDTHQKIDESTGSVWSAGA